MQKLNNHDLTFHHIGFAVRSMKESRSAFEVLGLRFYHISSDATRNLDFLFFRFSGGGGVELVSPHDPCLPSPVTKMVEQYPCRPYHICFKTKNLKQKIRELKNAGFKQIGQLLTSDVYGYKATGVFLYSNGTGVVELIQEHSADAQFG